MQPKSTDQFVNPSTRPAKQSNTSSVEVSVLLHVLDFFLFKDNVNEWVTFACDGTGPADESKRTKRVQGWSRLNWLGGLLIIVSWHIHFNKLSMPLTPVCFFLYNNTSVFLDPFSPLGGLRKHQPQELPKTS